MGRIVTIKVYFPLVAMVNLVTCIPLIRLFRSLCTNITLNQFINPTMNSSSETKNSEYAKLSEFGNTEVKFEVQVLITLFLRQAPVLFSMNRQT